ncbi:hypothetical protein E2C01_002309 [Portunus trituberculatus]|uniref:Uncharacterized protein n=1 Tax=Portunus trituberculatus TaxID=210409 RepID=A0A5B7CLL7_PORTR|nr:hypothetical protein [Portunus trituberculatus]
MGHLLAAGHQAALIEQIRCVLKETMISFLDPHKIHLDCVPPMATGLPQAQLVYLDDGGVKVAESRLTNWFLSLNSNSATPSYAFLAETNHKLPRVNLPLVP